MFSTCITIDRYKLPNTIEFPSVTDRCMSKRLDGELPISAIFPMRSNARKYAVPAAAPPTCAPESINGKTGSRSTSDKDLKHIR